MTPCSQDERPAAGAWHLSYGKGPQGSCGVLFCFMAAKESLKDKAYHAILQGIFSSEYKPNQILNEKELIERYSRLTGMSVSEIIRRFTIERVEEEMEADRIRKALEEYRKNPRTFSFDEEMERLGLE